MSKLMILLLIFFISGWLTTKIMLPGIYQLIHKTGFVTLNYNNKEIPCSLGVIFYLSSLPVFALAYFIIPETIQSKTAVFLFALSGFTLLGLIDDFWGSGQYRGISSHLNALLKGELTTGSVKAIIGILMAVIISASMGEWTLIPINALIIALSVNLINLLDVRPGRAGKSFLLLAFLFFVPFLGKWELVFIATTAGSILAYLPADLKSKAMMGDTGANALGAVLGLTAVWLLDFRIKVIVLSMLIFLHFVAEKVSFSKIFANNPVLNYLDRLGRE